MGVQQANERLYQLENIMKVAQYPFTANDYIQGFRDCYEIVMGIKTSQRVGDE